MLRNRPSPRSGACLDFRVTLAPLLVLLGAAASACAGSPSARGAAPQRAASEADAAAAAPEEAASTFTAVAELGLDLRALPTNSSTEAINLFVRGEADDLRRLAPPSSQPEIRWTPGIGWLSVAFSAATAAEAQALCTRVLEAYLAQAPRLPVIFEPAATLIRPCGPPEP